ncbi:MAG: DNA-directed RNA polymerase subunit omega [Clostridia bacterium]|nr:DNA-directed RNA polymerase subunit omega [Clostridia bacterium]
MMLYPTLDELTAKVGNRFYLVNYVASRARAVVEDYNDRGEKLDDKPVKIALVELAANEFTGERRD